MKDLYQLVSNFRITVLSPVLLLIVFLALSLLSGCSRAVTTQSLDAAGNPVTTTTERSFFASENLETYYQHEDRRVDKHTAIAEKKIDAIQENGRSRTYSTPTEATLGSIIDSLLIASIRESAPPPANPAPKTMGDYLGPQAVPLLQLGLGAVGAAFDWDTGWAFGGSGGEGNSYLEEVVAGGDIYINSQRKDQYYLEEGSAWGAQENPSFNWHYETNTGNSTNSGQKGQASSSLPSDDDMGLF